MFLIKLILMSMIVFLPFNSIAANMINNPELNAAVFNAVVQVMKECYEVRHHSGTALGKCTLDILHHSEFYNPGNYKVFLTGDVPGDSTLIIKNQAGFTITCAVSAQQKLRVSNCVSKQEPPLTNGEELSITPQ
jgi:hypothetical protein